MDVSTTVWLVTAVATIGVLIVDVVVIGRRPHEPSMRECAAYLSVYIGAAIAFGLGVWGISGGRYAGEFFAGWLTEYSLSVDNLFIFILIMAKFGVPRPLQQTALMIGIVLALIMRGIFIALGAAAIEQWSWIFYIFGLFLVWTAYKLATDADEDTAEELEEPKIVQYVRRHFRVSDTWEGSKLTVIQAGKRAVTPMFLVILALGMTDLLFALDSIPAIFGLTREPYLVFTANVFALMGLRQLYFLLGGLLERLIYLSFGLAFLLAFIGVKLVLHAMHTNELAFINGGQHIEWAPEIPIWLSLTVIIGTLAVTAVTSLVVEKRRAHA